MNLASYRVAQQMKVHPILRKSSSNAASMDLKQGSKKQESKIYSALWVLYAGEVKAYVNV